MEDRQQPFAAFVLDTLARQSTKLGQWWVEQIRLVAAGSGEPSSASNAVETRDVAERLVRTVLAAAADGVRQHESLVHTGTAMGVEAHRRNASLHLMLKELDLLGALLLRVAEGAATRFPASAAGHEGLAVARRLASATSQLRLAAATGYTQAIEDELRERYRTIRHDLRNPLGTIKTAVALLTDDSIPAEMRESRRVRAVVVRNTRSLDQVIGEALGDAAARLPAFDTSGETPADLPADSSPDLSPEPEASGREQRDDVARTHQRPDLETGML
jgi:signal transduction histidine kinase